MNIRKGNVLFVLIITAASFDANAIGIGPEIQFKAIQETQKAMEGHRFQKREIILAQRLSQSFVELFIPNSLPHPTIKDYLNDVLTGKFDYTTRVDDPEYPGFVSIPFEQQISIYGDEEGLARFTVFSERIVQALSFLFSINASIAPADSCVFFTNILSWIGMARAGIALLNNQPVRASHLGNSFGVLCASRLSDSFAPYNVYPRIFFDCLAEDLSIEACKAKFENPFEIKREHICLEHFPSAGLDPCGTVFHSTKTAQCVAFDSWLRIFELLNTLIDQPILDNEALRPLSDALKDFIFSMSWSSTFYRGQSAIVLWLVRGVCQALGYELVLPIISEKASSIIREAITSKYAKSEAQRLNALRLQEYKRMAFRSWPYIDPDVAHDLSSATFVDKAFQSFFDKLYKNPSVFALFCANKQTYSRLYDLTFKKSQRSLSDKITRFTTQRRILSPSLLPPKLELSCFSSKTMFMFLDKQNIQSSVTSVVLKRFGDECPLSTFQKILSAIFITFPYLSDFSLDLTGIRDIDNRSEFLKELNLFRNPVFGIASWRCILAHTQNLQNLHLTACGIPSFEFTADSFKRMKSLHFDDCEFYDSGELNLADLLKCAPVLEDLSISRENTIILNFPYIQSVSYRIKTLSLIDQLITESSLHCFSMNMPQLQHLNLFNSTIIVNDTYWRRLTLANGCSSRCPDHPLKKLTLSEVTYGQSLQIPYYEFTKFFQAESVYLLGYNWTGKDLELMSQAGTVEFVFDGPDVQSISRSDNQMFHEPYFLDRLNACGWEIVSNDVAYSLRKLPNRPTRPSGPLYLSENCLFRLICGVLKKFE
ncbi:MAG: hypothetical protein LBJ89_00145 [Holosporales bacterium]|jgi:hypothetical protein|nr:hypothetical protein [Holosporales bacterium]